MPQRISPPLRRSTSLTLALAVVLPIAAARSAQAASACYAQDCDLACGSTWSNFTTLFDATDYPAAGTTAVGFVDPADGSRYRFVPTQEGKVWLWDAGSGSFLPQPFLDLDAKVLSGGERGLLSLAVDPDYATNGAIYVYYTRDHATASEDGDIVVERYIRSTATTGDPTSALTILVIDRDNGTGNHNGGTLAFGPDGMLYVSTGDGGGSCDDDVTGSPHGQNVASLLGKVLRLDVNAVDPGATAPECGEVQGPYGIPLGNPFAGATAGCGEIWAYGLRNPFRMSFDRATGDLWLGDVGQNDWEEINFLAADYYPLAPDGAINFGWRCREGCETFASSCTNAGCPAGLAAGVTPCGYPKDVDPGAGEVLLWDPVLCHDNRNAGGSDWQSIIGGSRYRGIRVPSLTGSYLYGDVDCGQIWRSTGFDALDPAATTASCLDAGNGFLYAFAEDHLGELYAVFGDGRVVCFHAGAPGGCYWAGWGGMFEDGFETGDTTRWTETEPPPAP